MKKLLFISFLLLTLINCQNNKINPNWNKLDKMYYFSGIVKKGFDTKPVQQIISENKNSMFDVEKAKNKFKHSKNRGAKQAWKGGTCHAIAFFNDGSAIKLELSSIYGVFNILDNGCNYEITNDNILRSGRWEELFK